MSDNFEKKIMLSMMFDHYKELLTDKQREYFDLYINEDLSLNEIADDFDVSRAAVYDSIQKTEKILFNFEDKLKLVDKNNKLNKIVKENETSSNEDVKKIIKEMKEVL